jgi:hypothetical protein
MGMFDYIKWLGPIPKMRNSSELRIMLQSGKFQTKSLRLWEDPRWTERAYDEGCVMVTVDGTGKMKDPDGGDLAWSGELTFYAATRRWKWREFAAQFSNGTLVSIRALEGEP